MLLPMDEKQFRPRKMRRNGTPDRTIANLPVISRQAVSETLPGMDGKTESTLRGMAQANRIIPEKIDPEHGVPIGRSIPFKTAAIIFVPEKHGVRVWYEHEWRAGVV